VSQEGNAFIQRIDDLRKNLEVEGRSMNNIYRKVETEQTQKRLKSEKETKSQLKAANRVLQKQNRDLRDQIVDDRDAIINKAKQKGVVNWANAAPDTWQELSQNSYSPDM
jgi:predicted  nucleic acid-binding Zn-ribbon protein